MAVGSILSKTVMDRIWCVDIQELMGQCVYTHMSMYKLVYKSLITLLHWKGLVSITTSMHKGLQAESCTPHIHTHARPYKCVN